MMPCFPVQSLSPVVEIESGVKVSMEEKERDNLAEEYPVRWLDRIAERGLKEMQIENAYCVISIWVKMLGSPEVCRL
ncbi:hypothetical protein L1887_18641 [Cichorium endivia]|nr:hypothetical protein L1887_18641 [Cichorium endivia]